MNYQSCSITSSFFENQCEFEHVDLLCLRVFMHNLKYLQKKRKKYHHPPLFLSLKRTMYKFKNTLRNCQIKCNNYSESIVDCLENIKKKLKILSKLQTKYLKCVINNKLCYIALKCRSTIKKGDHIMPTCHIAFMPSQPQPQVHLPLHTHGILCKAQLPK